MLHSHELYMLSHMYFAVMFQCWKGRQGFIGGASSLPMLLPLPPIEGRQHLSALSPYMYLKAGSHTSYASHAGWKHLPMPCCCLAHM